MNYYSSVKDAPLSGMLGQASIKTENKLMNFSDYICQGCPDTDRNTGAYIIFYQCGTIYYGTHFPGPVSQSSAVSEYNSEFTARMDLAYFRIFIS